MVAKTVLPLITGFLLLFTAATAAQDAGLEQRGRALVGRLCSRCHAIDRTGASPHAEAPPFRTLGARYPIDSLAEALAEGLVTGHPDMPEFMFEVQDVGAILAYLKSIQDSQKSQPFNNR
jgi:mono/diheme cytochrome c family protein